MPAPQASQMKQLARLQFQSFAIKVPDQPPQMNHSETYSKGFKTSELAKAPDNPATSLFLVDSVNAYHVKIQKQKNKEYGDYIDGICTAICSAWSEWQSMAALTGVIIAGPTASGGQVVGPPLGPLILKSAPMKGNEAKYSTAIANAMDTSWTAYTASIKVTGLPWYPAFAAVPAPVAPPTPNVPAPLMALMQVPASMMKMALKGLFIGNFADPTPPHCTELFDCVADAVDKCFQIWQKATMVTQVIGTGPVPVYAPPYVPAGPVVGGTGNMTPGGFK